MSNQAPPTKQWPEHQGADGKLSRETLASCLAWRGLQPASVRTDETGWVVATWQIPPQTPFASSCELRLQKMDAPFWCVPGVFWGDNQQDTTDQYYPRFSPDLPQPHKFQSSFWEFDVNRLTQPLAAVHDGADWWLLEADPFVEVDGQSLRCSMGFEYSGKVPTLLASLPGNERPYRPTGHDYTMPMEHHGRWSEARTLCWRVRAYRQRGNRTKILQALEENYHRANPSKGSLPPAAYARAARNALMRWHYHSESQSFSHTVAFDRVGQQIAEAQGATLDRHEMALGWVNGWVTYEALADWAAENEGDCLDAISDSWQRVNDAGLVSPSGFWWTRYAPPAGQLSSPFDSKMPNGMDGNWMENPLHIHLRTLGDAVLRAARTLRKYGDKLPFADELRRQLVFQAELAARMARRGWPLPLSIDSQTGEPAGLQGTAGMIWISIWCELTQQKLWDDENLIRDGADFYRGAVESGALHGAPEDVGECLSSEDVYIAINAYLDAFKLLGRDEDLGTCRKASSWLYLWRKSFDHAFDKRTVIGVYDLKSRGGDIASFKNNHLHIYGLDIDESLRELAVIDSNPRWESLADDHWRFSAQLTPLVDGQFNAYEGMVTEQFYFIDWSALGNSVRLLEPDDRSSAYDVGPYYRNHGNLAGFSHAWCTAFVLKVAIGRINAAQALEDASF